MNKLTIEQHYDIAWFAATAPNKQHANMDEWNSLKMWRPIDFMHLCNHLVPDYHNRVPACCKATYRILLQYGNMSPYKWWQLVTDDNPAKRKSPEPYHKFWMKLAILAVSNGHTNAHKARMYLRREGRIDTSFDGYIKSADGLEEITIRTFENNVSKAKKIVAQLQV